MKLLGIEMDEDSDPAFISVKMSLKEAAFITKCLGGHNDISAENIMIGGSDTLQVYNDFTELFFNRFYHGGIDDLK